MSTNTSVLQSLRNRALGLLQRMAEDDKMDESRPPRSQPEVYGRVRLLRAQTIQLIAILLQIAETDGEQQ